jgi:hypothetical protein
LPEPVSFHSPIFIEVSLSSGNSHLLAHKSTFLVMISVLPSSLIGQAFLSSADPLLLHFGNWT